MYCVRRCWKRRSTNATAKWWITRFFKMTTTKPVHARFDMFQVGTCSVVFRQANFTNGPNKANRNLTIFFFCSITWLFVLCDSGGEHGSLFTIRRYYLIAFSFDLANANLKTENYIRRFILMRGCDFIELHKPRREKRYGWWISYRSGCVVFLFFFSQISLLVVDSSSSSSCVDFAFSYQPFFYDVDEKRKERGGLSVCVSTSFGDKPKTSPFIRCKHGTRPAGRRLYMN